MESHFEKQIKDSIINKTFSFEFPIEYDTTYTSDIQVKETLLKPEYIGYTLSYRWYNVIVSISECKGIEAYSLQFIEIKHRELDKLANSYFDRINNEFSKIVDLLNSICLTAPSKDTNNETISSNNNNNDINDIKKSSLTNSNKSLTMVGSNNYNQNLFYFNKLNKKNAYPGNIVGRSPILLSRLNNNSNIHSQTEGQKYLAGYLGKNKNYTIANNTINNTPSININSIMHNVNCFDVSLIYLLRSELNYVYDMYLTLLIFNKIRYCKKCVNEKVFNISSTSYSIIDNFKLLKKLKKFNIEFKCYTTIIKANYNYVRVLIFNMLMFIMNNTLDDKEKNITFNIKHEKFIYGDNGGSYFKMTFRFVDHKPIIGYSYIKRLIECIKNKELRDINKEVFEYFDIGLITCYFIATYIYGGTFSILYNEAKDPNRVMFELLFKGNVNIDSSESNNFVNNTNENNYVSNNEKCSTDAKPQYNRLVENWCYNKLLDKIYKIKSSSLRVINKQSSNSVINNSFDENSCTDSDSYESGCEDGFYNDDQNESIKQDLLLYEDLKKQLNVIQYNAIEAKDIYHVKTTNENTNSKQNNEGYNRLLNNCNGICKINEDTILSYLNKIPNIKEVIQRKLHMSDMNVTTKIKKVEVNVNNETHSKMYSFNNSSVISKAKKKYKKFTWERIKHIRLNNVPLILIVEDNWYGMVNIKDSIKKLELDFKIETAADGYDAINKFDKMFNNGIIYDFIFMDINLPLTDGISVAKYIRKLESDYKDVRTNIIAVTVEDNFKVDKYLFDSFCKFI